MSETLVDLRQEFRAGHVTVEKKMAVATGTISLDPADRAEILAILGADADERVSEKAQNALLTVHASAFTAALARPDAAAKLLDYCSRNLADKSEIADALAANPSCSAEELSRVAPRLSVTGLQAMFDDLDRLTERPSLAMALLNHAPLSPDQRQQLEELKQGELDAKLLADAASDAEPDLGKRESLLQRVARMKVIERVQLALKGGREERMLLIRDSCKVVQRAVLQSPKLSEREVESFSGMTSLSDEVLRLIGSKRKWRKNYSVIKNLASNAKVPLDISLNLLPLIQTLDLKTLSMNKNVPETLRSAANKLFRQRSSTRD
jgi:hypothetical protein